MFGIVRTLQKTGLSAGGWKSFEEREIKTDSIMSGLIAEYVACTRYFYLHKIQVTDPGMC